MTRFLGGPSAREWRSLIYTHRAFFRDAAAQGQALPTFFMHAVGSGMAPPVSLSPDGLSSASVGSRHV